MESFINTSNHDSTMSKKSKQLLKTIKNYEHMKKLLQLIRVSSKNTVNDSIVL